MSVTAWRIASDTRDWAADDLTGAGAEASGGRWNAAGQPVVYASMSRALACLETVVHLNAAGLPLNRYLVELTIPDALWRAARRETPDSLPVGWDAEPASATSIRFGGDGLMGGAGALLLVPSVVVPEEWNLLLNPRHAGAAGVRARKLRKWLYDPRLRRA